MCRHELAEITLTIVTAFATYLVANNLFGSSGVLAVVFLGMRWLHLLAHLAEIKAGIYAAIQACFQ